MYFIKSDIHSIKNLALIAINEKLYVEGFHLKKALEKILLISPDKLKTSFIILAKEHEQGQIVGISTFLMTEYCTVQTFILPEYRGKGYASYLITQVLDNVPEKFSKRIRFGLGEPHSFFLFRSLLLKGIIKEEQLIEEEVKTKLNVLDVYLFCLKHSLNVERYAPAWKTLFSSEEQQFIHDNHHAFCQKLIKP